ncbi:MAG: YkgJ family cysteine cluster protein [Idiomarina sp.]
MDCRKGCGACCIAPSISSPIPGMPQGKPAGVRCIHLTDDFLCGLFGQPERPPVCDQFSANLDSCGSSRDEALILLTDLEQQTS